MWMSRLPVSHPMLRGRVGFVDRDRSHKAIMSLFPATLPGEFHERRAGGNVLWRLDVSPAGSPVVTVQSSATPKDIEDGVGGVRVIEISGLLNAVTASEFVRLKVDVNAVHRRDGRVVGTVNDNDFADWFSRRLGNAAADTFVQSLVWEQATARGAALAVAHVVADVRTGNKDALHALLKTGLGRAKAYGCGLVLATPLG